ncbi:MAG: carboxypeptidase-like regulatory domain-containing protein [Candidatus Eisenbacteria bacterium]
MFLRILCYLSLLVFGIVPAIAQTDPATGEAGAVVARGAALTGRVTDPTGKPIADVSVGVTELRRGTATDPDGRYSIPSLPFGVYHVSFQRLGYVPSVRRFLLSRSTSTLDLTLA